MSDILNQFILWKPLKLVSGIMYAMVVLLVPMSEFWSVIMLFALVCLWSRIPSMVSIPTKDLDVVDFFVVMLAIHVSGWFGGIFGFSVMLFSRIFGPREWILYTVKDAISMMLGGFLTPVFYAWFGSALGALYAFTIFRWVMYLILTAIMEPAWLGFELGICTIGSVKSYFYNTFVMKSAEKHLLKVFEGGVHFTWTLFLFATIVVGAFYLLGRAGKILEMWMAKRQASRLGDEYPIPEWSQRPQPWID